MAVKGVEMKQGQQVPVAAEQLWFGLTHWSIVLPCLVLLPPGQA